MNVVRIDRYVEVIRCHLISPRAFFILYRICMAVRDFIFRGMSAACRATEIASAFLSVLMYKS